MVIRDHENGILLPVGDEDALVSAMREIADNPDLARRIGVSAAKIRDRLTVESVVSDWADALGFDRIED